MSRLEIPLPSYKLYKLDPVSEQREPAEWLDAADDDDAIKCARELARQSKCEIWLQDRLVSILVYEP